jgi:hypothetical protein
MRTPPWFQALIGSRRSCAALREHLARQPGEEKLEFLLVYMGFTQVANGLQRFEHLRTIIHRFIRDGSERCIPLSAQSRRRVVREWAPWQSFGRIPEGTRFPSLEAAAEEIHKQLSRQGNYSKQIAQWLARYSDQRRRAYASVYEAEEDFDSVTLPMH